MELPKIARGALALCLVLPACGISLVRSSGDAPSASPSPGSYGSALPEELDVPDQGTPEDGVIEATDENPYPIVDYASTGSAARGLLRPTPYTEIVIEIDYAPGLPPSQQTIAYIGSVLRQVTKKKVTFAGGDAMDERARDVDIDKARSFSARRRFESSPPRGAIWIGYFAGTLVESDKAIAAAVDATSVAVFPDHFRKEFADKPHLIESTAVLHELGHVLGQTGYGYESPRNHHDGEHPGHNLNPRSVMYWQADGLLVTTLLRGDEPLGFDANDLADLADLRNGEL